MNVVIKREKMSNYMDVHGGECASMVVEISIDDTLDQRVQRNLVIHAILENYFRSVTHDKIDELTEIMGDALDGLEDK